MKKYHPFINWSTLILIISLILLSIYGAFLGSASAQNFFNSRLIAIYWFILLFALSAGLVTARKLIKAPGLLLIHLGCILVLVGALYGSEAGHQIQKKFFGIDKIRRGQMLIYQNQESNQVKLEKYNWIRKLPFSIKLKDFRIEYYEPRYLRVQTCQTGILKMPVRDYISNLAVIKNGKTVTEKNVEINHPLHFGGYYIYQHSYDSHTAQYTVLMVVSDSGLSIVYAGYLTLITGVFWHFWLKHLFRKART